MQLTSLEIFGFKTFADRTKFYFDEGVTGIVGPNGCGKSNVVDAIRWVLGEQRTRNLRSEKMEDVIFNGTSKRRMGQVAEVSLSFDNTRNLLPTAYSTVKITRRLYRSGESEYLINDTPCRLKDIHDLFMDTGIGADSYSIIEQEMVKAIIVDKDNSRRDLFEEAAGISKYKTRKKETLRKIADTDQDLARVEDILFEIGKNLKTLEGQAKKARKYLEIKKEYTTVSAKHAWFTVRDLREALARLTGEEQEMVAGLESASSTIARHEARQQELRLEITHIEKELAAQQRILNTLKENILNVEKEKSIQHERLKYLQQREFAIQNEEAADQQRLSKNTAELEVERQKLADARAALTALEAGLQEKAAELDAFRSLADEQRERYEACQTGLQEAEQRLQLLLREREVSEVQRDGFQRELERNSQDLSGKTQELAQFAVRVEELENVFTQQHARVEILRKQKEEAEIQIRELTSQIEQGKDQIYRITRGLDARQHEFQLTKSLVENLEGFPDSVKYLRKEAGWMKDAPLVSDILYTTEQYKVALENLLEAYLSYYVVPGRQEAMQCIRLLADSGKGRANFFIMNEIKAPAKSTPAPAGCVPAISVVEVLDTYRPLMEWLLHDVFILQNGELPEHISEGITILNPDGTFLVRNYMLSGGSVGLFQGKRLGRARNLQKLEQEIQQISTDLIQRKADLEVIERKLAQVRSHTFARDLEQAADTFRKTEGELNLIRLRQHEYQEVLSRTNLRTEDLRAEVVSLDEKLAHLYPQLDKLQITVQEQRSGAQEYRLVWDESQLRLQALQATWHQANMQQVTAKNAVDMLQRETAQREAAIHQLRESIATAETELTETRLQIKSLVDTTLSNDEGVVMMYAQRTEKEQEINLMEAALGNIRNSLQQVEQFARESRQHRDTLEDQRNKLRERASELRIRMAGTRERMHIEFSIDIEQLNEVELFDGKADPDAFPSIDQEVNKLRSRLQSYGEINPMAVEAYDEMKQRFDFIETQKKDLLDARASLLSTIREIDQTATEKFLEAFNRIRENFRRVFPTMFNPGDDCDLILEDPHDPLDSPIDILAKPKGKRPSSISQISNGEKAMTAVSLLFSIYLLKPAPFCVFDEVDAPLDDLNVEKFNNIVREFSQDSQFIIVTHNKRTMSSSNVIYGVTMPEQGVSRVLPVNLDELGLN